MAHDLGAFGLPKTLVSRHMPWAQEPLCPKRIFKGLAIDGARTAFGRGGVEEVTVDLVGDGIPPR